jgi:membrane-associated phospholipid phosphatase
MLGHPRPESAPRPAGLRWPGRNHLLYAARLGLLFVAGWALVFVGADRLTSSHARRVRVHCDAELAVPFVPEAWLPYQSVNVLIVAAPFFLASRRELRALTAALLAVTFTAGTGFVLIPAANAYPPPPADVRWGWAVRMTRELALENNLVPSLHVALAVTCAGAYALRAGWGRRLVMAGWAMVVAASTVLLHEHHLIDVVSGLGLGGVGVRFVYRPLAVARTVRSARSAPGPAAAPIPTE